MKILHVCHNYYPAKGGPQYTMKHLSEKLVSDYGDEVQVVTSNSYYGPEMTLFKKVEPASEVIEGVKVERIPFTRWHYPLLTFSNKVSGKLRKKALPYWIMKRRWGLDCKGISRRMQTTHANVIMATTINYNFCDYPSWRFTTRNPKPFVLYGALHLHYKIAEDSPFLKRAKACDCYIANTEFEKQSLVNYGVDAAKIITIGTGVAIDAYQLSKEQINAFRRTHGIADEEVLIGYVGRLSSGKGVGLLLDAYAKIYRSIPNARLMLAGSFTDYVREVQSLIENQRLPAVLFVDFEDSLKPLLFNAFDIFVLPSRGESFGAVFLEAWACCKPVVGANIGAIASLVSNNSDGLLFEPNKEESLRSVLNELISAPELRRKLGTSGFRKVNDHFAWDVIAEKYRNAYLLGIQNFEASISKVKR